MNVSQSIKKTLRRLFGTGSDIGKGYTNPRRDPDYKPVPAPRRRASAESCYEWCRAFNRRNDWIVPEVSPESIYRKTLRKVGYGKKQNIAA